MRILYVATNFTALTHTFITREVSRLRALGVPVDLLSLRTHTAEAGTADPECDLTGCRFVYPASLPSVLAGLLRCVFTHPGRLGRAARAATASSMDSFSTKLKLLYQVAVATMLAPGLTRSGVTHIHAHFATSPASFAMFLSLLTDIPFSFTGHAADVFRDAVALDTKLRLASGVRAISQHNLRHFLSLHPRPRAAPVIHCGVDLTRLAVRPRTSAAVPLRVLAVGRLVPKKGFVHLLEALAMLSERGLPWRAELVGDGPLCTALKEQAERHGLKALRLAGPQQQERVGEMLRQADVFVLPCVAAPDGDVDGIPVSLMEAMASGCPVVSTRVSGIPELVEDGVSGLLVSPADPAALAGALERLARDPALVARLSAGGREKVEQEFDLDRIGTSMRDFFSEIASARGST